MSETMNSHIRHLQERLKKAEWERDEALAARDTLLRELIMWCETGVANHGERSHLVRHLEDLRRAETRKSRPD